MKTQEKLLHLSLIAGILTITSAPLAHAWPDPNKAFKDAQKAGRKASKQASKQVSKANKQASSSAKKAQKQLEKSAPKKMHSDLIDVCKTPSPAGPVPIPYPNSEGAKRQANKAKAKFDSAQKSANAAAKSANTAAKNASKNARCNLHFW